MPEEREEPERVATADERLRRRGVQKRQPLNCGPCRRQKLRCDRCIPCSTCVRYQREDECRLNPAPSRKKVHRSRIITASKIPQGNSGDLDRSSSSREAANGEDNRPALLNPVVLGNKSSKDESGDFVNQLKSLGSIDVGSIPSVSLPQLLAQSCRHETSRVLWSTLSDSQHRNLVWKQQLTSMLPSRAQCDLLVNFYIEHINWIFQTLHEPSFRREYSQFWDNEPQRGDFIWLSLLYTTISVSALYVPLESIGVVGFPVESIRPLAHLWHNASQQALRAGDYESHPSIRQLQTFVITQLYWYATNRLEKLNSRLGQAVRCAQALGLDRDISTSTCLGDEIRHRMWWELVDSDMFQTICLDREPLIRLKSCKVPLPLNCGDSDMTSTSIHPQPTDRPTEMALNISRAKLFQLLNLRHHGDDSYNDKGTSPYDRVRDIDTKIESLLAELPWYFQLDEDGNPPQLPEHLHEIITWQHHILRTCICTQRIRMYRPFLSTGLEGARHRCLEAALDAVAVYKTLRKDVSQTSWHKFLPQAYQIFSVSVTVAALLLVEGNIDMPSLYESIKDMVTDLQILDRKGCHVPVATQGRKILLKLLSLIEMRVAGLPSPDETESLVPQISGIMGGERTTREYMGRLADDPSPATRTNENLREPGTGYTKSQTIGPEVDRPVLREHEDGLEVSWMGSLLEMSFDDLETGLDSEYMLDAPDTMALFNWDMTGFLANAQYAEL